MEPWDRVYHQMKRVIYTKYCLSPNDNGTKIYFLLIVSCPSSEYLCDMYLHIEEERLQFICRGHLQYAHEIDCNSDLEDDSIDIRLPVSFLGSREWCSSEAADSLALAQEFRRASLFVTMTCDTDWPEIVECLHPGQTAYDVSVVIAHAFKCCLQQLLDILDSKFRTVIYMIHIIEFQKRGFPHAHIVLKVHHQFAIYCNLIINYIGQP